jgi:hypothetical protein
LAERAGGGIKNAGGEKKFAVNLRMEIFETVQCPFCGQEFEIVVDTSGGSQRFTTDCEICCRPMEIFAECRAGEILRLEILGN